MSDEGFVRTTTMRRLYDYGERQPWAREFWLGLLKAEVDLKAEGYEQPREAHQWLSDRIDDELDRREKVGS